MAVWTRPSTVFPCLRQTTRYSSTSRNGVMNTTCSFMKTQLCTLALSLTLVNSVRLPREAFRYGAIPYLVVYSFWLLVVGLATSLVQLATGQLSQQDPVGVWRAVPILRGVGHIQIITSYLSCVYNMLCVSLASAYIMWIAKDTFPLRACTKLQMTASGYENKINASECFNSTFLSPIGERPEYIGIMAIIIFLSWFFLPIFLCGLAKSVKITMSLLAPSTIIIAIVFSVFLSREEPLQSLLTSCEKWAVFTQPYIWFSSLVQALLSTQIASGHLISAGGTIYKHSDVRWVSASLVTYNMLASWLWVILWQSTGGHDRKDTSFISVLVLIYQSSMTQKRSKLWPLLGLIVIFLSGVMTVLTLLYPVYDRLQRLTGDKWKLVAAVGSALGTFLTVAILVRALEVASILDELVVPVLAVFSTTLEVVGFVFIYGCTMLRLDIKFLSGVKTSTFWLIFWCATPVLLIGVTGWWLRVLLRETMGEAKTLWPLGGAFIAILVIMAVMAAVAVAKEEQFNLLSKIASAFRPSRLWGPEDPTVRYNWMVSRYNNDRQSNENNSIDSYGNCPKTVTNKHIENYNDWLKGSDTYQKTYKMYTNAFPEYRDYSVSDYDKPEIKKKDTEKKFYSPNICIASEKLDSRVECKCNRHFTLNVPYLKRNELTTSL